MDIFLNVYLVANIFMELRNPMAHNDILVNDYLCLWQ